MIAISTKAKVAVGVSLASLLVLITWLKLGVYTDREFGDFYYVFPKHRLSFRFYFYSPSGESDIPMSSLTPAQQEAEMAFEDFVERSGGYDRRW
jgi:hypothetical protein